MYFLRLFIFLLLCLAGFSASPVINYGLWVDTEPVIVTWGFCVCAIILYFLLKKERYLLIPKHPSLLLLVMSVGISLIFLPMQEQWLLSVLGPPNLGQGIINQLFMIVAILFILEIIEQNQTHAVLVIISSSIILIGATYLSLNFPEQLFFLKIHAFEAWVAVLGLAIASIGLLPNFNRHRLILLLLAFISILLSKNKTVLAVFTLCTVSSVIFIKWNLTKYFTKPIWGIGIVLLPVLVIISLIAMGSKEHFPSLYSRLYLLNAFSDYIKDHPNRLIFGSGWGSFGDIFLQYGLSGGTSLYQNAKFNPSWDVLKHLDYHTMNQAVEGLLSIGILGFLIELLIPAFLWYKLKPQDRPYGLLIIIPLVFYQSLWFYVPSNYPFLCFIWSAMIFSSVNQKEKPMPIIKYWLFVLCPIVLWATFERFSSAYFLTFRHHPLERIVSKQDIEIRTLIKNQGPAQIHLANMLRVAPGFLQSELYNKDRFDDFLRQIASANQKIKKPSNEFLVASTAFYATVFKKFSGFMSPQLQKQIVLEWKKRILEIVDKMPQRSDLITPYIFYLLKEKKYSEIDVLINLIKEKNLNHCVVIFFQGLYEINANGNVTEGKKLIDQAKKKGLSRYLPV